MSKPDDERTDVSEPVTDHRDEAAAAEPTLPVEPPPKRTATPPAVPVTPPPKRTATPPAVPVTPPPKRTATPPAVPVTPPPKRTATPPAVPVTPPPKRTATPPAVPVTPPPKRTATPPAGAPAAPPTTMAVSASAAATTPVAVPVVDAKPTSPAEDTAADPTPAREPVVPARHESPVKLVPTPPAESEPGTPEEIERPNRVRTPPAGVPRRAPRARSPSPVAEDRATPARAITNDPPSQPPQSYRASSDALPSPGPSAPALADPPGKRDSDPSELPTATATVPTPWAHRLVGALPWLVIALPALYQLFLLSVAITARITYPYDLEWMEGGMLHHALRIQNGEGIYVPPSIDFIPYLYTPLYPSLLAMLGGAFGLTYTLGRAISVLSLIGIAIIGALQIAGRATSTGGARRPGPGSRSRSGCSRRSIPS